MIATLAIPALLLGLGLWVAGAVVAFALRRRGESATRAGIVGAVAGGVAGLVAAAGPLGSGGLATARAAWPVPFGSLSLRLDPLAATFLVPVCLIGALAAIYGGAYLRPHASSHPPGPRFAAYNLLLASMALVVTSSNLLLFLFAWEAMTLTSWALVVSDHESSAARRAGLLYLVAAHIATAALMVLFLAVAGAGGWDMEPGALRIAAPGALLFALALVGFGTKAGIVPFHVWLPDAHAAAPGHVSALMSGVMITMGFYGLARFLPMLGPATQGSAAVLMLLGAAGALGAIAHSLVQRDVKRALAYSTVENAGLVTLALGVARLAEATGHAPLAALAWTAALLHLWNHAIFKSLLFLGVGEAAQATGSRDLETWGGLMRRSPRAGAMVAAGGAAIAGVPPFNGFVSEWLILATLFSGAVTLHGVARAGIVLGIAAVAATAALALAGAARLIGIGWLGTPRSEGAARAPAPARAITGPMIVLAALSLLGGCLPLLFTRALVTTVAGLVPGGAADSAARLVAPVGTLALATLGVVLALGLLRRALDRGRSARRAVTWGCGYARPAASMQYTGSSLSEPVSRGLAPLLRTRVRSDGLGGFWPVSASWESQTLDRAITDVYRPLVARLGRVSEWLRNLQEPHVTTHLRYLVLALLVVLGLLFLPLGVRP